MARPIKTTVDIFPHATRTGKTVAILEAYWGNDGYAFWFKVLELLGGSAGFLYHCNKPENWEYLLAKTRVTEKTAVAILDKLAELDAIDAELWENGIIWSNHFVDNLTPVFARRKSALPRKPEFPERKFGANEVFVSFRDGNAAPAEFAVAETDKEKERKGKESKAKERNEDKPRAPRAGARSGDGHGPINRSPGRSYTPRIAVCHGFWPDREQYRFFAEGPPTGLWNRRTRSRCRC